MRGEGRRGRRRYSRRSRRKSRRIDEVWRMMNEVGGRCVSLEEGDGGGGASKT